MRALFMNLTSALLLSSCAATGAAGEDGASPPPGAPVPSLPAGDLESDSGLLDLVRAALPAPDAAWPSTSTFGQKSVFLTFDDGPKPYKTTKVLAVLEKENVKATFFLIGRKAEENPLIVDQIVRGGHTVGNHSYSHMMAWGRKLDPYVEDAVKGREVLERMTGRPVPLYRSPGGNLRLIEEVGKIGMKFVLWTTLSGDCASGQGPGYLLHLVKRQERERTIFHYPMIILMHDTATRTAEALPGIIAFLRKKGYKFQSEWY